MNQSEQINELASALIKVQANLKPIPKDSENSFFHSHYADLTSIWEAIRKPLTDNGLCVVQTNSGNTCESITVDTMLLHTSGQWISGSLTLKASKIKMSKQNPSQVESEIIDPQSMGSALTYARRYALAAIVGVCPEDDDAEGAMDRKEAPKTNGKSYKGFPETDNPDIVSGSYGFITEPQGKRLYAIYKAKGLSDNEMKEYLFNKYGIKTSREISRGNYESIIEWINNFDRRKFQNGILSDDIIDNIKHQEFEDGLND